MNLKGFFAGMAEHHVAAAKGHEAMASEYPENSSHRSFHESMRDSHTAACEECLKACKGCSDSDVATHDDSAGVPGRKAVATGGMIAAMELDKIMPTAVHGVLPDNPTMGKNALIPRFGTPLQMPDDGDPTSALDRLMGRG